MKTSALSLSLLLATAVTSILHAEPPRPQPAPDAIEADTIVAGNVTAIMQYSGIPAESEMEMPAPLTEGDLVVILSPAGEAHDADFGKMASLLEAEGLRVRIAPHAAGLDGDYSGSVAERLSDLADAINDPDARAILCSRGGYGAVHLLESLDTMEIASNAKWLIGFSDITALHALWQKHGVGSLHGPMGINLTRQKDGEELSDSWLAQIAVLFGARPTYRLTPHPLNRTGEATGRLTGGNMAVADALISTPFNPIAPGAILFIEDVDEPIYKIERQLYRLKLSGVLEELGGLIVGDFTNVEPDPNHSSMAEMISEMVADYDFPVVFGFPGGHSSPNLPLLLGADVKLTVTDSGVEISQ